MPKILAYKNQQQINNILQYLNWTVDNAQIYIDKYKSFAALPALETIDIILFFNNPRSFIVQKLTNGEVLKVGNLTLSSEKVYDMMDRPAGLDEFITEIEHLKSDKSWREIYFGYLNRLDIVNGKAVPKQSYIDEQTELNSYYIESENQNSALNLMNEIAPKLNSLFALLKSDNNSIDELFTGTGTGKNRTFQARLSKAANLF
ncbi:hypothetical protein [Chryseobacterium profundimaris]|uniref:Uncharacterized protein n=1 Tax=Chryseobacterium profundimaris TaxID=1387275 RepID=A0ABY1NGS4_9FLAO|nr:hypothetical protein [Chryseobacterium profundimaris]SMP08959.1 hypothetical protein SAMN06264346_10213 [Chryseobacterium profundimaris]